MSAFLRLFSSYIVDDANFARKRTRTLNMNIKKKKRKKNKKNIERVGGGRQLLTFTFFSIVLVKRTMIGLLLILTWLNKMKK